MTEKNIIRVESKQEYHQPMLPKFFNSILNVKSTCHSRVKVEKLLGLVMAGMDHGTSGTNNNQNSDPK